MKPQQFLYSCVHCAKTIDQVQVVARLDDEVVIAEAARRRGRLQTSHAGPGRPTIVRCPGCDGMMSSAELRDHRVDCVRNRLKQLQRKGWFVRLSPKDPDPYPDFAIRDILDEEVRFEKLSSSQYLAIELRKIADISPDSGERVIQIRLLGRVRWDDPTKHWRYEPTRLGRPPLPI